MCTVTFLPTNDNGFILTSSRDIPFSRKKALQPENYLEDGVQLWYPKDGKAGGTWIGTSDKKRLICLLNGGFEYHTSLANYKKSRGLIVKELLKTDDIEEKLDGIDLMGVEQFTLVIVDWKDNVNLLEFVWDGVSKHLKKMKNSPYIWSSSTLYDQNVKKKRQLWFERWQEHNKYRQERILEFHRIAGVGDPHIDVMMNRKVGGTVSITSIELLKNDLKTHYEDVLVNAQ